MVKNTCIANVKFRLWNAWAKVVQSYAMGGWRINGRTMVTNHTIASTPLRKNTQRKNEKVSIIDDPKLHSISFKSCFHSPNDTCPSNQNKCYNNCVENLFMQKVLNLFYKLYLTMSRPCINWCLLCFDFGCTTIGALFQLHPRQIVGFLIYLFPFRQFVLVLLPTLLLPVCALCLVILSMIHWFFLSLSSCYKCFKMLR